MQENKSGCFFLNTMYNATTSASLNLQCVAAHAWHSSAIKRRRIHASLADSDFLDQTSFTDVKKSRHRSWKTAVTSRHVAVACLSQSKQRLFVAASHRIYVCYSWVEVRAGEIAYMDNGATSSLIRESCLLRCRRVRSVASDLLRHQIRPLAFCRGRHVLYIGASHSVAGTSLNRAARDYRHARRPATRLTADHRGADSPTPFACLLTYLLPYGRLGGRQAV